MAQTQPLPVAQGQRLPPAALALAALTVLAAIAEVVVSAANRDHPEFQALGLVAFLAFPAMGLVLIRYRPRNPIGWLLLGIGLNVYLIFGSEEYAAFVLITHRGLIPAPVGNLFAWLSGIVWLPLPLMVLLFVPMLFPDGRLLSRRWRVVVASGLIFAVLAFLGNGFRYWSVSPTYPALKNPLGIPEADGILDVLINTSVPFGLLALLGSIASLVVRYRRADPLQRRQLRWFVLALALSSLPFLLKGVNDQLSQVLVLVAIPLLPVGIAIAILRYRLYDIDVVINRALVYGALAVFISVLYVAIVVGVGTVIGNKGQSNLGLAILATAIVAVAFEPIRSRFQRLANRIVYGKRATPYEVMTDLARRMAATLSADEVLPRMAEAAARGVDASAASVSIRFPDGSQRLVWWPNEVANATAAARLPVAYRGNEVGELTVVKPAGQQLSRAESRLLADLSSQAGLVLHNLRLTDELEARLAEVSSQAAEIRASRQRLVSVADTERQRLVETIQRGPESQLKTLAIELAGIEGRVTSHPLEASERLDQLTNDAQNSLDKLRQVARGVYPALLRDKGLLPALRSEVAREAKAITISAEGLGRYPLNVEGVVFFSCQEVLRRTENVSEIALHDGRGMIEFSVAAPHAELASMVDALEDRIEAMGGGIAVVGDRLVGRIPAQAAETIA